MDTVPGFDFPEFQCMNCRVDCDFICKTIVNGYRVRLCIDCNNGKNKILDKRLTGE